MNDTHYLRSPNSMCFFLSTEDYYVPSFVQQPFQDDATNPILPILFNKYHYREKSSDTSPKSFGNSIQNWTSPSTSPSAWRRD